MKNAAKPANALVVGGGIVGLACAIDLQRRGIATLVCDPALPVRSASFGNAGHIAVEQVEPLAAPGALASLPRRLFSRGGAAAFPLRDIGAWLPFGCRLLSASSPARFAAGTRALRSLLAEALPAWQRLTQLTGTSSMLVADGHYIVWETAAGAHAGRESWSRADTGTARFQDLDRADLERLAALTGRAPAGGLRFSGTARVRDPGLLHDALAHAFEVMGGQWRRESVAKIPRDRGCAQVLLASGEKLTPDLVVVATGVATGALLRPLGHCAPLIAERGYHIQADAGDAWPDLPPVVFEERSMIVSRFTSGLRAAGFVEFSRMGSPPDARKWQRLRAHAEALRLPFAGTVTEWMGARPTLPDYLPAVGRSRRADNLVYAFGHQHLGLTLAAITGELVGAVATGDSAALDLSPFDVERFGGDHLQPGLNPGVNE